MGMFTYDNFLTAAKLLGGLAVFIYGMNFMGDGLQKAAGDKMRKILAFLTRNPFTGVLAGALVTMIIQSSSATTVMVVGFVGAKLLTLPQAISVILGANIGTTITAQIVAFDIGDFAYFFAAVGFILYFFFAKKDRPKYIGQIIFAFGLLFIGFNTMSGAMSGLAGSAAFRDLLLKVSDVPFLGLLVGALATCVVQSSSATIAIIQNLAGSGLLTLPAAIPLLLGSNIGTTITAFFSSIGAKTDAKRAAMSHTIFNLVSSVVFMLFVKPFSSFISHLPDYINSFSELVGLGLHLETGVMRDIANAHTLFNLFSVLVWIPLIPLLTKLVKLIYKEKPTEYDKCTMFISDKVSPNTAMALELAAKELSRMADFTRVMLKEAVDSFLEYDAAKINKVNEIEEIVDLQQNSIIRYLSRLLSSHSLTTAESVRVTRLMKATSDIERVGDYCVNITDSAKVKKEKKLPFSDLALKEIRESFALLTNMLDSCIEALKTDDSVLAAKALSYEDKVDALEKNLRKSHLERLHAGLCDPEAAITYIELIHHMERIGDHCNNVAEAVLGIEEHDEVMFQLE